MHRLLSLNGVLLLAGLVFTAIGGLSGFRSLSLLATGTHATATVVDEAIHRTTPAAAPSRTVVVAFQQSDGTRVRAQALNSSDAPLRSRVRIVVKPGDPPAVYLPDETSFWLVPAGLMVGGLFACLVAGVRMRHGGPVRIKV